MKKCKNTIFSIFSDKYGKMSKKVKNDENGSDIDEKGKNWWKNVKITFFPIFSEKYGKKSKKWKMMKIGQILMKNLKIDEKWKQ